MTARLFVLLLSVAAAAGCGGPPPPAGGREVRAAVAANLKPAFEELSAAFRADHPDVTVTPTYGASGTFFAQLSNKAPFDLFLSADAEYPKRLADQGATAGPPFRYATGRLAVWVPAGSPLDVDKLGVKAAAGPGVRTVAVANPRHAPYGRAAEAALKAAGVYNQVAPKLAVGDNVEQTAQFVQSGAADLGFVPLSLALTPAMTGRGRYAVVPAELHPPIEQAGVVLGWAGDRTAAESLRNFLIGPASRAILGRHGYEPPGGAE